MNAIICVDDNYGIFFNNRRQSRDRFLIDKVIELVGDKKLWLNHYSRTLFQEKECKNINISDSFLSEAAPSEFCFVEGLPLKAYEKYLEKVILFKWNRVYPADVMFDIDLSENWHLTNSEEFVGNSHEVITMEVYER